MGLYLEEFELNVTRRTRGRTIGEGDVSLFAGLVGDYNPLHVDEEFCKETKFGGRIAHGPLSLSVAIGLMSQLNWIDGTALGLLGLRGSSRRRCVLATRSTHASRRSRRARAERRAAAS